jgi:hypothetical protein
MVIDMRWSALLVVLLWPAPDAAAQPPVRSFADLPRVVAPGERVIVHDTLGATVRGRLLSSDGARLEVEWRNWHFSRRRRALSEQDVRSIEIADSTLNGELAGLAAGIAVGTLVYRARAARSRAPGERWPASSSGPRPATGSDWRSIARATG